MRAAFRNVSLFTGLPALRPGRENLPLIHSRFSLSNSKTVYKKSFCSSRNMDNSSDIAPIEVVKSNTKESIADRKEQPARNQAVRSLSKDIEDLHREACEQGNGAYRDPATGYTVITEYAHLKRGKCCGNACRHCPFDHVNVKKKPPARNNR